MSPRWLMRLHAPGRPEAAIACAALAFAVLTAWPVRGAIQSARQDLLRAQVALLDAAPAAEAVPDAREVFLAALPPARADGDADTRIGPGLLRRRIDLDYHGDYAGLRATLADRLNAAPHLALDSLSIRRVADRPGEVVAHLRFSAYLREAVAP